MSPNSIRDNWKKNLQPIQDIILPVHDRASKLYIAKNHETGLRQTTENSKDISVHSNETVSTQTFFNSFFVSYWREYTGIADVHLSFEFVGAGLLRVCHAVGGSVTELSSHRIHADTPESIRLLVWTRMQSPAIQTGRIFWDFNATTQSCIQSPQYVTSSTPTRQISLALGLCTFNRQEYLANTLCNIASAMKSEPAIDKVTVVNQGDPLSSALLTRHLNNPNINLINQRNLGGCGGFTRTMLETLKSESRPTHLLLMDDDIVLDERVISRTIRFLSHTVVDMALGGGMLNSKLPTVMYEAGAFLDPDNKIRPYCQNKDLTVTDELAHFDDVVKTDYNAWWYCVLPMDQVRQIGLPVSVFIRGDDFEYGQRLAKHGIGTVTLPGVAVWHEPFDEKPPGWQSYYDLRNRMIFAATYPDKVASSSLFHMVNLLITPILTHQYNVAAFRSRAVIDFLSGPDKHFSIDPNDLHTNVCQQISRHAPISVPTEQYLSKAISPDQTHKATDKLSLLRLYGAKISAALMLPYFKRPTLLRASGVNPATVSRRPYIMTTDARSYHLLYSPNRRTAWGQIFRAAILIWRYRVKLNKVSLDWNEKVPRFRTEPYWESIFSRDSMLENRCNKENPANE